MQDNNQTEPRWKLQMALTGAGIIGILGMWIGTGMMPAEALDVPTSTLDTGTQIAAYTPVDSLVFWTVFALPILGALFARAAVYSEFNTDQDYTDIVSDGDTGTQPEEPEPTTSAEMAAVQAVETQRDHVRELHEDIHELSVMFQTVSGYAIEETDITGEELRDVIKERTNLYFGESDE
jgi:hypothetical protein